MIELFKKKEDLFTILIIIIYVVLNSYCINSFGTTSYLTTIMNTCISVVLIYIIKSLKREKYYGLNKVKNIKKYLYFIPLLIIGTVNIWNGLNINNTPKEILFYILTMINVGFIEEIIFRGFLFKMIEKDSLKKAIVITSITFALGHIVNLLNGQNIIDTLLQICYALSLGYLFVTLLIKTKSLYPSILTHILINSLAIFASRTNEETLIITIILIIVSISYSIYLKRRG